MYSKDLYLVIMSDSQCVFYTTQPFGQGFLLKSSVEYHIHYEPEDDSFESAYLGTTGRHFMNDVYKFILKNAKDDLKDHGRDVRYDEDGSEQYLWVHLEKTTCEDTIDKIIKALEDKYKTEWRFHRVPKLLMTLQSTLRHNSEYLANAVSHFQRNHGFQATQDAVYTLFNQIKPKYTYWLDCDIESESDD